MLDNPRSVIVIVIIVLVGFPKAIEVVSAEPSSSLSFAGIWLGDQESGGNAITPEVNESFYIRGVFGNSNGDQPFSVSAALDGTSLGAKSYVTSAGVYTSFSFGPLTTTVGDHKANVTVAFGSVLLGPLYQSKSIELQFTVLDSGVYSAYVPQIKPDLIWSYPLIEQESKYAVRLSTSTDGSRILLQNSGDSGSSIRLLDSEGNVLWKTPGNYLTARLSSNGKYVSATYGWEPATLSLTAANGDALWTISQTQLHPGSCWGLCAVKFDDEARTFGVSRLGQTLVAGYNVYLVGISGNILWESQPFPGPGDFVSQNPLGWYTASGTAPQGPKILNSAYSAYSGDISPDGAYVIVGTGCAGYGLVKGNYGVYALDGQTGKLLWKSESYSRYRYTAIRISPDDKFVLALDESGKLTAFGLQTGRILWSIQSPAMSDSEAIYYAGIYDADESSLSVSPDGNLIGTAILSNYWGYGFTSKFSYAISILDRNGKVVMRGPQTGYAIALTSEGMAIGNAGGVVMDSMLGNAANAINASEQVLGVANQIGADLTNQTVLEQESQRELSGGNWFASYVEANQARASALETMVGDLSGRFRQLDASAANLTTASNNEQRELSQARMDLSNLHSMMGPLGSLLPPMDTKFSDIDSHLTDAKKNLSLVQDELNQVNTSLLAGSFLNASDHVRNAETLLDKAAADIARVSTGISSVTSEIQRYSELVYLVAVAAISLTAIAAVGLLYKRRRKKLR